MLTLLEVSLIMIYYFLLASPEEKLPEQPPPEEKRPEQHPPEEKLPEVLDIELTGSKEGKN